MRGLALSLIALATLCGPLPLSAETFDGPRIGPDGRLVKEPEAQLPSQQIAPLTDALCRRGKACSAPRLQNLAQVDPKLHALLDHAFSNAYCYESTTWENISERYPRLGPHILSCFRALEQAPCGYYTGELDILTLPGCKEIATIE